MSIWIALPVTLLSAVVAFCCACFPTGFVFYGAAYGVSYPNSGYAWLAPILIGMPWLLGLGGAWLVGLQIWKAFGSPSEDP